MQLQAGSNNFKIIILNIYYENHEILKRGVSNLLKSPS